MWAFWGEGQTKIDRAKERGVRSSNIWGEMMLCPGHCPVCCGTLGSIHGPRPPDPRSSPRAVTTKNVSRHCLLSPGRDIIIENHRSIGDTLTGLTQVLVASTPSPQQLELGVPGDGSSSNGGGEGGVVDDSDGNVGTAGVGMGEGCG